jgi:hypothetical protein
MPSIVKRKILYAVTCDGCGTYVEGERLVPIGWRRVSASFDRGRRFVSGDEIGCSPECVAKILLNAQPAMRLAWSEAKKIDERGDACEACGKTIGAGWHYVHIQLSSENGYECVAAETRSKNSEAGFMGEAPSVCSVECADRLLNEIVEKVRKKDFGADDRAWEERRYQ